MPEQTTSIEARLKELGIELPQAAAAAAAYVPYTISGNVVYISGQLPLINGKIEHTGVVGTQFNVDEAAKIAHICAVNLIAQLKNACDGNLEKLRRVLKLTVFVNSAQGFSQQHLVANGASNLIREVFGDKGAHARSAIGVYGLPLGVPVEVEGIFEIER